MRVGLFLCELEVDLCELYAQERQDCMRPQGMLLVVIVRNASQNLGAVVLAVCCVTSSLFTLFPSLGGHFLFRNDAPDLSVWVSVWRQ